MKKTLLAIAVAAATVFSLGACGNDSNGGSENGDGATAAAGDGANNNEDTTGPADGGDAADVTITMMAAVYSDLTKELWEGFIADFQAEHPNVTINLEMQSWDNINDVIKTKVQGNQAPDILSIDAFSNYVADDLLYSADELLSADTIADFQDSFVANATMEGKQFGFPLIASARALFINNVIFEEAGLDPNNPPATWQELADAAKTIVDLDKGYYGYGMPLGAEEAQAELGIWIMSNGGGYGDTNTLTIDDPKNIEAAEFMAKMIADGLTQPDPGATGRTPMLNNVFMQGKMGMAVGLPPIMGMIEEQAPDLNYSIVPFPTNINDKVTLGVADHLMAFKNDGDEAKKQAIGQFIDFFYRTDNYVKFVDTEGFLPTTKSGAEATTLTQFGPFNDVLPFAKFYPSTNPDWGSTQGLIQQNIGKIASGEPPANVLADIQASSSTGL
ncbi:MAG: extracellular solute-binding protein [Micrococcales bacterium]|nr:extracellular solute-binding protein [Micrococcales bacterium]